VAERVAENRDDLVDLTLLDDQRRRERDDVAGDPDQHALCQQPTETP
jgi:hypothetical protein